MKAIPVISILFERGVVSVFLLIESPKDSQILFTRVNNRMIEYQLRVNIKHHSRTLATATEDTGTLYMHG